MDHGNPSIDGRDGLVLQRRARDVRARRPAARRRRPGPRGAGARRPDDGDARGRLARRRRRRSSTAGTSTCAAGDEQLETIVRHRHGSAWLAAAPAWPCHRGEPVDRRACAGARPHRGPLADAVAGPSSAAPLAAVAAAAGTPPTSPPLCRRRRRWPAWRWPAPLVVRRRPTAGRPRRPAADDRPRQPAAQNRRVADVPAALARLDADVLTFSELTPIHATHLRSSPLAASYPYRIELPERRGSGTGLWSRHPITQRVTAKTKHHTVVADVAAPGGTVRLVVIHTQSPVDPPPRVGARPRAARRDGRRTARRDDRRLQRRVVAPRVPAPARRGGWRDAHISSGRGLSCSWPTEQWHPLFRWHPPFVRLDHALVNDGLARARRRRLRRPRQRPPGDHGHRAASCASNALNARPRWDRACFSSSLISANVRPSPSAGTNTAS